MLQTLVGQMETIPRRGAADLPAWLTSCEARGCRRDVRDFERYTGKKSEEL